ncbi:hypothetical protein L0P88_13400 [Muricauda sp. SCSIO 64092]|uniref:hypothetical protein n=1 Tax=Allomuricauda sp. SCSIO 64092 TaxID=2908842 RepID=UPI001FF6546C|nr:hypothetical protein [Muricauda sp. SCSIO 64092]UOY04947.1 hypothetical protein L0P88_13400 [Muricauda sp. SCSIO 64092]
MNILFPAVLTLLIGCTPASRYHPVGEAPFAINGVDVPPIENPDALYEPQLVGPWKKLYHPQNATYMNDHTVYRHTNGSWHVIGIGNQLPTKGFSNPWTMEVQFTHGSSKELLGDYTDHEPISRHPNLDKDKTYDELKSQPKDHYPAWAPHAIRYNGECWLFYAPQNFFIEKSKDMSNWEIVNHYANKLPVKNPYELEKFDFRNGGADIRDYMILRIDKETWLLYHTGIEKGTGVASITVYESKNGLANWKYVGEAMTFRGIKTKPWSSGESPFVFKRGNYFYLSLTHTSGEAGYHQTWMFRSKDPYYFGNYGGIHDQTSKKNCDFVTGFGAHAPEIIYEPDANKWYMTTCGWSWDRVKKPEAASGGVAIAEIEWKKTGATLTNHDFEYGTLTGWEKEGEAFELSLANYQHKGKNIKQNGSFFVSSLFYESSNQETFKVGGVKKDASQTGVVRSESFILTKGATLDFLIMGGNNSETLYVALVDANKGGILAKTSGNQSFEFERKKFDVSQYAGQECYLEIVDNDTTAWGHISVDDVNLTIKPQLK